MIVTVEAIGVDEPRFQTKPIIGKAPPREEEPAEGEAAADQPTA